MSFPLRRNSFNGGGYPFPIDLAASTSRNGGGQPLGGITAATYVPGNDASTSPFGVGALPMAEPLDDGLFGATSTLNDVRFPMSAWAPVLRAQLVVAEFGGTGWRDITIPSPSYDPDDLRDEIITLINLRELRSARIGEIVEQARDFTNYFANVLMISPASHPARWALLCAGMAIGQMVGMYFKNKWPDRPRPVQVYPPLMTAIPTPPHPSYPNAHALQARLIANSFTKVCGALAQSLDLLVERIAENRAIAGVHFVTDKIGSEALASRVTKIMRHLESHETLVGQAMIEWQSQACSPPKTGRRLPPASIPPADGPPNPKDMACSPVIASPRITMDSVALLTPPEWTARNQGNRTTCVAFAAVACVEQQDYESGMCTRLSEQYLYWAARKMNLDDGETKGVIRLKYARDVLITGICEAQYCEYDMTLVGDDPGPDPKPIPPAAIRKYANRVYYDLKCHVPSLDPSRVAWTVAELLSRHRKPVAVCLKIFENADGRRTTWTDTEAIHYGFVADPASKDTLVGSHCICIVGWQPDEGEPSGGYFVFRNSWGSLFGERAPSDYAAGVPAPGYGLISAGYINTWCYEILQVGDRL